MSQELDMGPDALLQNPGLSFAAPAVVVQVAVRTTPSQHVVSDDKSMYLYYSVLVLLYSRVRAGEQYKKLCYLGVPSVRVLRESIEVEWLVPDFESKSQLTDVQEFMNDRSSPEGCDRLGKRDWDSQRVGNQSELRDVSTRTQRRRSLRITLISECNMSMSTSMRKNPPRAHHLTHALHVGKHQETSSEAMCAFRLLSASARTPGPCPSTQPPSACQWHLATCRIDASRDLFPWVRAHFLPQTMEEQLNTIDSASAATFSGSHYHTNQACASCEKNIREHAELRLCSAGASIVPTETLHHPFSLFTLPFPLSIKAHAVERPFHPPSPMIRWPRRGEISGSSLDLASFAQVQSHPSCLEIDTSSLTSFLLLTNLLAFQDIDPSRNSLAFQDVDPSSYVHTYFSLFNPSDCTPVCVWGTVYVTVLNGNPRWVFFDVRTARA
ncbi:hypothetical protein K438DRAFT_1767942 [Mycena galopus ATCC 62051]|nr:hypothetical protein K438DRAFT_1767942 [Mycena galopus ATCC 62051]